MQQHPARLRYHMSSVEPPTAERNGWGMGRIHRKKNHLVEDDLPPAATTAPAGARTT